MKQNDQVVQKEFKCPVHYHSRELKITNEDVNLYPTIYTVTHVMLSEDTFHFKKMESREEIINVCLDSQNNILNMIASTVDTFHSKKIESREEIINACLLFRCERLSIRFFRDTNKTFSKMWTCRT